MLLGKKINLILIVTLWAIAYGFMDELHQYFVTSRSATIIDFVKDTIGVLIVYSLVKKYYYGKQDNKISLVMNRVAKYLSPRG